MSVPTPEPPAPFDPLAVNGYRQARAFTTDIDQVLDIEEVEQLLVNLVAAYDSLALRCSTIRESTAQEVVDYISDPYERQDTINAVARHLSMVLR